MTPPGHLSAAARRAVAGAEQHHGLPPGVPVPAWAGRANTHPYFLPSGAALKGLLHKAKKKKSSTAEPAASYAPSDAMGGVGRPQDVEQAKAAAGNELGLRCGAGYCPSPPLRYMGGVVQHEPKVHLIFWGSNWLNNYSGVEELVNLFEGLSGSGFQRVLSQYFDNTGHYVSSNVTVSGIVDESLAAPQQVNDESLRVEIQSIIQKTGWVREADAQFVLLPAPGSTYQAGFDTGFCAYHNYDGAYGIYGFVPYAGDPPFSTEGSCDDYYGYGDAVDATSVMASHEYAEAATDPYWDIWPGWLDYEGYENGDICSTPADELPNGSMVQGTYDNYQNACSLSGVVSPHVGARTEMATNVGKHSATITGAVDPENQATTYRFEWGTSTEYGNVIPSGEGSAGSSLANVAVSANLSGLELERVYHYRVRATNASGTAYGEDRTFVPSVWTTHPQAEPARTGTSWLNDVSCPSTGSCMAVGRFYNANESPTNRLLAYQGSGSSWQYRPMFNPPESEGFFVEATGVSCSSQNACTAVGKIQTTTAVVPIAERWNGSSWAMQAVPAPAGSAYTKLTEVSCVSGSECIAVGYSKSPAGVFGDYSVRWNGSSWSSISTPNPEKFTQSLLEDVSCPQANYCVAVGWSISGESNQKVILKWDGTSWAFQTPTESEGWLGGVDCRSVESCTTVGGGATAIEAWDGSKWTSQATPPLTETKGGFLLGVSCTSAVYCTAVGGAFSNKNGAAYPLVEVRTNGGWHVEQTPRESETAYNELASVSCIEMFNCAAAGGSAATGWQPLIETKAGKQPIVTAKAPVDQFAGKVKLQGGVNPNGQATTYRFEWGTSTEYGNVIPIPSEGIGSGTEEVTVSKVLEGLKNLTTYHFRLVASSDEGMTYGEDQQFTYDWHPQISYQLPASVGRNEVTLTAGINPRGLSTTYRFEWGSTAAYGHSIPVPDLSIGSGEVAVAVKQGPITGLAPHAKYHFRVVASNAEGTSYGADQTFETGSTRHWFACTKQSGGKYISSECAKEGSPKEWELVRLKEGEKTTIAAAGKPIVFAATISGTAGSFSCETEVVSPSLENPSGAGNGVGNAQVKYKGCKAEGTWGEKGCKVEPTGSFPSKLEVISLDGKPQVILTPTEGTTFATFSFSSCTISALNGAWSLTGVARAVYSNSSSQLEFSAEGTSETLKLRGNQATATGTIGLTATGGGQIKAEPAPPIATTEAATAVKPMTATLQGTVNPEGADTRYQFEYGKTTAYGQSVPVEAKGVGEGVANVKVSEAISSLTSGTVYHYRLVAISGVYTSYGADMTFTTTAGPLRWFACTKQSGRYTSSTCAKEGSPKEWESVRLKEAEKTTIAAKGNPIAFTSTQTGVVTTFSCETEVASPSLENPSGATNGIGNAEVKYKGCKPEGIAAEKGCKVENTANFASKLELVTIEGKVQVAFKPTSGEVLAKFSVSSCSIGALNGTYELKGTMRGLYSNANSKVEFNAETTAEGLSLRGQKATAVGSIGLETTAGGRVKQETATYWYGCAKQTGGRYTSNACTTEGAPEEWESILLKKGEKTTVTAKGAPITLAATVSGIAGSLTCETEVTSTTLENPGGGGSGAGNAQVKYKGCKAEGTWGEKGCKVESTGSFLYKLGLISLESKPQVILTPTEGTTLATFSFSGCSVGALNGSWSLTGTIRSPYSNSAGALEFNAGTTSETLKLKGNKATAVGSIGLETTAGGHIKAE